MYTSALFHIFGIEGAKVVVATIPNHLWRKRTWQQRPKRLKKVCIICMLSNSKDSLFTDIETVLGDWRLPSDYLCQRGKKVGHHQRKYSSKMQDHSYSNFVFYRPGQPNWEYTMWKFFRICLPLNFGHFEATKLPFWPYK